MDLCPAHDADRLRQHLQKTGLMTEPPFKVTAQDMISRMQGDKKNRDGQITLILAKGIGQAFVDRHISQTELLAFLETKFG